MNSASSLPRASLPRASLQQFFVSCIRFISALCIALWVGGLAFFGIMAAPVLFHPERFGIARASDTAVVAPQMVSAMLTRFGTLSMLCAVLLLLCALLDGALTRAFRAWIWRIQAALCLICLLLSLFLSGVLLPQTRRAQSEILPLIARAENGQTLSPEEAASRARFDRGHALYQSLASINIYLLLAVLFLLFARSKTVTEPKIEIETASLADDSAASAKTVK